MSTVQRIAKNAVAIGAAQVASKLFSPLLTVFAARILGSEHYGQYAFAGAFVALSMILADLGLDVITIREIARDRTNVNRIFGNALLVKLILVSTGLGLTLLAIRALGYPPEVAAVVSLLAVGQGLVLFQGAFIAVFRGLERMEFETLVAGLDNVAIVGLGITVLRLGGGIQELAMALLAGHALALVLAVAIAYLRFLHPRFSIAPALGWYLLLEALPFGVAMLFMAVYVRASVVLLSMLKGDASVGWYDAAYRLITLLMLIPGAFMGAVLPVMSTSTVSTGRFRTIYEASFRFLLMLALPLATGGSLLADKIVLLVYGMEYAPAVDAARTLFWALPFMFTNMVLGNILLATGQQRIMAVSAGLAAALNVSLNMALVPRLGHLGSAIVAVVTEVILCSLMYIFVNARVVQLELVRPLVRLGLSCILMAGAVALLAGQPLFVSVPVGGAVYMALLVATGAIDHHDWKVSKKLLRPRL